MDTADSSEYSDSESSGKISPIDIFMDNEMDNLIDLFRDLKDRFPYFLGDRSEVLTGFLLDHLFDVSYKCVPTLVVNKDFLDANILEISITYTVVDDFLASRKWGKSKPLRTVIDYGDWVRFCHKYT